MEFDDIIEESLKREFNEKCNNNIILGIYKEELKDIKKILEENKYAEVVYHTSNGEQEFKIDNIVIDLAETRVNEVIKEVTRKLGKGLNIPTDYQGIIRLFTYLLSNDRRVQINFFNYDILPEEQQILINNFFLIDASVLAVQVFFDEENDIKTLETSMKINNKTCYLDDRENYNLERMTHYFKRMKY